MNWKLVGTSCAGFFFFSIMTSSLSVFMLPLSREFGWSRTLISAGVTLAAGMAVVLFPFVGVLIDRYGARRIAMPGLLANAIAISAFSLASGSASQWLALWAIYALVSISIKTTVWTSAISGVFFEGRGLALGVTLAGTAVAQSAIPPLASWLITAFDWRAAYLALGSGFGAVTFLLCFFFLYDARDSQRRSPAVPNDTQAVSAVHGGLSVSDALRDSGLWRIGVATLIMFTFGMGLLIHQIAILADVGVPLARAAWLASLAGVAGIIGKLVSGVLLDRFRGSLIGGVTLGSAAFAYVFLIDAKSVWLIVMAMVLSGYVMGAKLQIASYMTLRYSGLRNMGVIYGTLSSIVALATGIGPLVAGSVYDLSGSYDPFLVAGAIGSVVAGLLFLTLPKYPDFS